MRLQRMLFGGVSAIILCACTPAETTLPPDPAPTSTNSPTPTASRTPAPVAAQATLTPTRCVEQEGQLRRLEYPAVAVEGHVPAVVYLPPCFGSIAEPIPAFYLLHGYPFDQNHWIDLGIIALTDQNIASGRWPPFILVMPLQPEPLFRSTAGGPGSYEQEFLEGLLPHIESRFAAPSMRGLLGISRGGIWALEIGLRHAELISLIGAFSPALAVNYAPPEYDPFELVLEIESTPDRLLLLYGVDDWARTETLRLSELMTEVGVEHRTIEVPGEHLNETWARALGTVFDYLLAADSE